MKVLNKAIDLAISAHKGQTDRGGVNYLAHLFAVMGGIYAADEELKTIAILHDIVEDTAVRMDDLVGMFSYRICSAVNLLTKKDGQTDDEYYVGIASNIDAVKVKESDLTHNSDLTRLKVVSIKDSHRVKNYQRRWDQLQDVLAAHLYSDKED